MSYVHELVSIPTHTLFLFAPGVEELEDLSQLSFLRCLDLSCNAIGDVATVSSLKNLVELDLRDNNMYVHQQRYGILRLSLSYV